MTTMIQTKRAEAYFVADLKAKSTQELRQFLAGAWMASILSEEAIEQEETEEDIVAVGRD